MMSWKYIKFHKALIAPRALATSGRRPGVRAKRAARGVAGRQLFQAHETAVQLQLLFVDAVIDR